MVWPSVTGEMIILEKFLGKKSRFAHLNHASAANKAGEIVGVGYDGEAFDGAFQAIPK